MYPGRSSSFILQRITSTKILFISERRGYSLAEIRNCGTNAYFR